HNNHHAFQYSARHGLEWWEIDLTWMMIQTLAFFSLAKNIKLPVNKV
ncbi:MAG: acyl-CoA desaturase, partial [Waterburya sp.]